MLRLRNINSKDTMLKLYKAFILPHLFFVLQCGIFVEHATVQSWKQLIGAFLDLF